MYCHTHRINRLLEVYNWYMYKLIIGPQCQPEYAQVMVPCLENGAILYEMGSNLIRNLEYLHKYVIFYSIF